MTVTVKLQWADAPQLSLAVVITVVVPTGNQLPLGGVASIVGGGLQPPEAEQVKKTVAPFELVAITVRFEEQVSVIAVPASADPAASSQTGAMTQCSNLILPNIRSDSVCRAVTGVGC